jgi:hypothetical protein
VSESAKRRPRSRKLNSVERSTQKRCADPLIDRAIRKGPFKTFKPEVSPTVNWPTVRSGDVTVQLFALHLWSQVKALGVQIDGWMIIEPDAVSGT